MISSGTRHLIQFLSILFLLNVILAVYETPKPHRYPPSLNNQRYPPVLNNQRSADSGYRYAWFTRDIQDDMINDDESNVQEEQLSPQELLRMKMLKSIFHRKYPESDEISSK